MSRLAKGPVEVRKRQQREESIKALPAEFHDNLSRDDDRILNLPIAKLHSEVSEGRLSPAQVVLAYGKKAIEAQRLNNPLTEVMIIEAYKDAPKAPKTAPLYGVPVSLKDMLKVKGYDASIGFKGKCFQPSIDDMPLVKVIKAAGGIPYVKTNVPLTMLSFECYNDVFGITENPAKAGFTPGGSSGGEASLIAHGGSRIGVGSDVAGSVRLPAHFCGIYALRPTTTRFPRSGGASAIPGQEGVPSVNGPLAKTLGDLEYFFKAIIDTKPWNFDYQVTPLPWQEPKLPPKLRFGVVWTDGIVDPSPACARALRHTVSALQKQGHEIKEFDIKPYSLDLLNVGAQLLCADGLDVSDEMRQWGETQDAGVYTGWLWTLLPSFVRNAYAWYVEHVRRDVVWATLLRGFGRKTVKEQWALVSQREQLRSAFFDQYNNSNVDFLLTVPNATPAFRHRGLRNSWASCLYTFMFNVLDYPAGVLPVTTVDRTIDAIDAHQREALESANGVSQGAYWNYDAEDMHGLPVGVQVVGKRFREEEVLAAMRVVSEAVAK